VSHFGLKTKRTDDGTVSFRKLEVGLPQLSNPTFKLPFGLMNFSYRRGTDVWDSWTDLFMGKVKTSTICTG